MKLSDCTPGIFVSYTHDPKTNPVNIGQVVFGISLNEFNQVLVHVQWAGQVYPVAVHPGNLSTYKG